MTWIPAGDPTLYSLNRLVIPPLSKWSPCLQRRFPSYSLLSRSSKSTIFSLHKVDPHSLSGISAYDVDPHLIILSCHTRLNQPSHFLLHRVEPLQVEYPSMTWIPILSPSLLTYVYRPPYLVRDYLWGKNLTLEN